MNWRCRLGRHQWRYGRALRTAGYNTGRVCLRCERSQWRIDYGGWRYVEMAPPLVNNNAGYVAPGRWDDGTP